MPIVDVHTHMFTRYWLELLRERADRVLFGTDWPHQVHDVAGSLAKTAALPADQRDAIRGTNALRVFGI